MAFDAHKNFAYGVVATAPSPSTSGTTLILQSGQGAAFATPPFNATVWPASPAQPTNANAEIVRVTAKSTNTLTITRAQEGSTARAIVVGDQIAAGPTVKTFTDLEGIAANRNRCLLYSALTAAGTGQVIPVTAWTPVTFDTEVYDIGGMHAAGASQVVIPAGGAGTYLCTGKIGWQNDATGDRLISIQKNGVFQVINCMTAAAVNVTSGTIGSTLATLILELVAGDIINLAAYHSASASLRIGGDGSMYYAPQLMVAQLY